MTRNSCTIIFAEFLVSGLAPSGRALAQSITIFRNKSGQPDGLPAPVKGEQARYIPDRLADASRPFGNAIEVKGETGEIGL